MWMAFWYWSTPLPAGRFAPHETATAIPQRMRLATRYDGIRARESQPPLTSVNMHLDEVAR